MKHFSFLLTISLVITLASCSKKDDNNSPNATDQNFMTSAAFSNRDEIDLAQLALTKTTNDSVKMFAQMMIADHTFALIGLDSLSTKYNVALPNTIDSAHAVIKMNLMPLAGYSFDSAYIKGQVTDHANSLLLHQSEAGNGNNQDVKNFANSKIPVIQMHLSMAQAMAAQIH